MTTYRYDAAFDQCVAQAYEEFVGNADRTALMRAAKRLGVPRWVVTKRGACLGLARAKEKPWGEEELALLHEWRHYSPSEIARRLRSQGFQRSHLGVQLKRKRLHLTSRNTTDGFTANALAGFLNMDRHKVSRWIQAGLLPVEKRLTCRRVNQGGDEYWIRRNCFRAFVIGHPEEIDLRKVDSVWFIELLTDIEGGLTGVIEEEYFTCP